MQYPDITAGRMHGSNAYEREQKMWEAFQRGVQENNALAADAFRRWQERDDAIKAEERAREAEWAKMQELYRQQVAEREGEQRFKTGEREASQDWNSVEMQKGREFEQRENRLNRTSQEKIAKGHDNATKHSADRAYSASTFKTKADYNIQTPAGQLGGVDPKSIKYVEDKNGNLVPATDPYGGFILTDDASAQYRKAQAQAQQAAQHAQQNPNHTGPTGLYSEGGSHDVNAPLRPPNEPEFKNPLPKGKNRLEIP